MVYKVLAWVKKIYPAFPFDAKGLLNAAINDPNQVLFFEHKALYRSIRQNVPNHIIQFQLARHL